MLNVNWILPFILGYFWLKRYISSTKFTSIIKKREKKYKTTKRGASFLCFETPSSTPLCFPFIPPSTHKPVAVIRCFSCVSEREWKAGVCGERRQRHSNSGGRVKVQNPKSRNPHLVSAWASRGREIEWVATMVAGRWRSRRGRRWWVVETTLAPKNGE